MKKLIDLCNAPQGKRILMEMFKDGKKVAEDDISDLTCEELSKRIKLQEMQGRTYQYKTVWTQLVDNLLKNGGREMTTKHTPGEWQVIETRVRAASTHVEIAHCKYQSGEENKANAQLIAAAPELLDALKGMVAAHRLNF